MKLKRLLASLLTAVLLLGMIPVSMITASADEVSGDFHYVINGDTEVMITRYAGVQTVVTVPAAIAGKPVVGIDENAFLDNTVLSAVTLPDGLISLGAGAFSGCTALAMVTIPNTLVTIGENAFSRCPLTSVYYNGNKAQWTALTPATGNDALTNATVFVNYCHGITMNATTTATCTAAGIKTYTCKTCNKKNTEPESALGHNYIPFVTPPTCTEDGYTTYICDRCSASYIGGTTDALGHSLIIDSAVAPGCTTTGLTEGCHCARCNYRIAQKIVPALNHNYEPTVTPPTCTDKGFTTYTCTRCRSSYITEYTDALGHSAVTDEAASPTCIESGLTEGSHCSRCETVLVAQNRIAPLGHDVVIDPAVAPGCTATGLTTGSHCKRCSEILLAQETVAATGHAYQAVVTAPTCTERGYTTYTCPHCDAQYTDHYTDELGHIYVATVTQPTCDTKGYTTYTCSRCNDSYNDHFIDEIGHSLITITAIAPTCTTTGLTAGCYCTRCNYRVEQTTVDALGHDYHSVITAPTCTEGGYTTFTCSRCNGAYAADETAALGHHYTPVVTPSTCTEKGYTTYICDRCDKQYIAEETAVLGHHYVESVIAPTCTADGYTLHKCSRCDASYQTDPVEKTGHTYTPVITPPTCDEDGFTTYTCANCGDSYVDDYVEKIVFPFEDTVEGKYYYSAIRWAYAAGVTQGTTKTEFLPDGNCTRAQVVTFLWRTMGCPAPKAEDGKSPFTDVAADAYYYDAVLWAYENGITTGTTETNFAPDIEVTRSQFVTFLWRCDGKKTPTLDNKFEDVTDPKEFYYDAVLWAAESGITQGVNDTSFAPALICTRAQVVTFLYRYAGI